MRKYNYQTYYALTLWVAVASLLVVLTECQLEPSNAMSTAHITPTVFKSGNVTLTCTNCDATQKAALQGDLDRYVKDRDSKCFSDSFTKLPHIDETHGMTAIEMVNKLRTTPINTTITFYSVPWYAAAFHPECGADNDDGTVEMKVGCFNAYPSCLRASFLGHEFSHGLGFTHNTAGNKAAGNQLTPPYIITNTGNTCCTN